MKFLLFYRIAFVAALAVILPVALIAADNEHIDKPTRLELTETILPMVQDSTASRKKSEGKPKDKPEKLPEDVQDERLKEAQRRSIKQVPRSIPKLKPQPVTDRVKIKRPPIKIPKKGVGGLIF